MKNKVFFSVMAAALLSLIMAGEVAASMFSASKPKKDPQELTTIRGKVIDAETNLPLVFAGVAIQGSNVSTVTNLDGEFILKVTEPTAEKVEFSYVGYKNVVMAISEMKTNGQRNVISLETAMIPIKEIIVKPLMPAEILEEVISRFEVNYPGVPNDMTGFYRETIKKNRNYVSIGEAVVEVFKAPYQNDLRFDAVKIYKGRKNNDVEKADTVLFRLQGGPTTTLYLDIVKNPEIFLTREALAQYDFELSNIVVIDDRTNYVIN
ncbi:MAG: carboxypeptidase-like regulatory domain-containing protein, partial [Bacteroidales bacterium]|nr:carboxypeptidase-like regulatory domain-containing protein [Bacteroidales bacterium]